MLIAIIGIDGSGKTTQAMLLYKNLKKLGYKVKVIYAGSTGIKLSRNYSFYLSLPLDVFVHRVMKMKKQDFYEKYPKLTKLEEFLLFLNYILLVLPKIFLCRSFFKVTIADRYVYDYILSCIVSSKQKQGRLIKILFNGTPKPDLTILLDTDENIAYHRKHGERPISDLKRLRKLYLHFIIKFKGEIVETHNIAIDEVFTKLRSLIMKYVH
ncbi:MAG: hypothetical protein QXH10_10270 [Ignisphaera sp.]